MTGDRVLLKDETGADAPGNGIFIYDSATAGGQLSRTTDADNTPSNEVSGGMFTFVEEGATLADNGYVMSSPEGNAVLGSDDLVFSQFSGAGQIDAGLGLTKSGNTLDVNTGNTAGDSLGILSDVVIVRSTGTAGQVLRSTGADGAEATWGALDLTSSNAVNGSLTVANGGTGLSAFADRSVLVSTGTDTLSVLTVGVSSVDQLLLWDDSADDFVFVDAASLGTSYGQIAGGDGGTTAAATSSNELITFTGTGINVTTTNGGVDADTVVFAVNIADIAATTPTVVLADTMFLEDGGSTIRVSLTTVVDSLNIPHGSDANMGITGFAARIAIDDGGNDWVNRTLTVGGTGLEGIDIVNPDGIAGDPVIGLDITGLTLATVIAGSDQFVMFDGVNNVKVNASEFITDNVLAFVTITPDTGTSPVADSSADTLSLLGTASGGITTVGDSSADSITFGLTLTDLADGSAETVALDTEIALNLTGDASTVLARKFTFTDVFEDLDVPNAITTDGFVVRDNADSYVSRTIEVEGVGALDGLSISNGDGGAANPIIGLDINGLTLDTTVSGTDELVIFNGSNNVKTTVSEIVAGGLVAWTEIAGDSGSNIFADTSSDLLTFNGQTGATGGAGGVVVSVEDGPEVVNIDLDINNVALTTPTIASATDAILLDDGGVTTRIDIDHFLNDLDIPNGVTTVGVIARTGGDTYGAVNFAVDGVGALDGLALAGTIAGGTLTFGLDINGLPLDTVLEGTNKLAMWNGSANVSVTIDELLADNPVNLITQGDSNVTVTDAGTGAITTTVDSTLITTVAVGSITNTVVELGPNGAVTAPTYSFANGTDSGLYLESAGPDTVCISADSKDVHCFRIQSGATGDEHLVSEAGDGEGRICAEGTATNVDIRLCPKGTGSIFLGDPGSSATIATSDGVNATDSGENLTIQTGDGNTTGAGGNIQITAGASGATAGALGGDITLTPGLSTDNDADNGIVCITDANAVNVTCLEGVASAVNNFVMTNAATGKGPILEVEGTDVNIDIEFLPKGTGVLSIDTDVISAATYRDNLTDDSNDIPNTAYVAEQVAATGASVQRTLYSLVNDTGVIASTINIPLNADITRVVIEVLTVYAGTQGFDLETAATANRVAADSEGLVDWQTAGVYVVENYESVSLAASDFQLDIQNATGGTGTASIRVEFTLDV